MRTLFHSVMFGAILALGPIAANATLLLQGDPGPIGGTAQTMLIDLAGTNTADMSNFVIEMSPKHVELIGTGTITIAIDINFASSPTSDAFSSSPGLELLDMDGIVLATSIGGSGGAFSDSWWEEGTPHPSALFQFQDILFHGLDWIPALDPAATFGSRTVTSGSLAVNFDQGDFGVGVWAVPEPATLALFGIGLAGLGFARKKRKSA